jgi:hypothetical protein
MQHYARRPQWHSLLSIRLRKVIDDVAS